MKKTATLLSALMLTLTASAQTLNVTVDNVTYQFPASQAGEMSYTDGTTLTIMGKTFTISDITRMYIDNTAVTDNQVTVAYSNASAKVTVAGNVAQYVTPTFSGAHVSIDQSNTDAVDEDEITYVLTGTSTDGAFDLSGSYKCTISLAGVQLTNPNGSAINISNKKRIQLSAKKDTENTLADGANGEQKACIYSKGQLQLQGNGTLNVVAGTKHGIKSASYISVKNLTLNITSAAGDGISCEEYFLMKSGTLTISGTSDDGIQCDLDEDKDATAETEDHEDENSGNIYLLDGTLTATVTATAAKGLKAEGSFVSSGGKTTVSTSGGGAWDTDDLKTKASAGISADGNISIGGGTFLLTSTGAGGKGISADGTFTMTDGNLTVKTTGGIVYYSSNKLNTATSVNQTIERLNSNYKSSPKGIKVDGAMTISGGTISATASSHEAIETKSTLNITGGTLYAQSTDDAINSGGIMTISGGTLCAYSTGNDGLDANADCYIKGGNVYAIGAQSPEVGIDALEQRTLSITGGNVVAIGGLESGASVSINCQQLDSGNSGGGNSGGGNNGRPGGGGFFPGGGSGSQSWQAGTWYALYNGSSLAFAFKTPSSGGSALVVCTSGTPTLYSSPTVGTATIWDGMGATSGVSGGTAVSLTTYNSGNGR